MPKEQVQLAICKMEDGMKTPARFIIWIVALLVVALLYGRTLMLEERLSTIHKVVNLNVNEFVVVVSPTEDLSETMTVVHNFIEAE